MEEACAIALDPSYERGDVAGRHGQMFGVNFMKRIKLDMLLFAVFTTALVNSTFIGLVFADDNLQLEVKRLQNLVQNLSDRLAKQDETIAKLKQEHEHSQPVSIDTGSSGANSISGEQAPVVTRNTQFIPDIGLVADITAFASESDQDTEGNDKISVREIELVIGHEVDPYSRFDSTITFSDTEDVEIEEAYLTRWDLPFGISARLGRMRPKVGKASAIHRDQLDTADQPLVIQRYLGVEGLFRTGLEVGDFLPIESDIFTSELILGFMEGGVGEDGSLFGETRRRPSYYARSRNYWEISDSSDVDLGLTYLLGSSDEDSSYEVGALGTDLTVNHHLSAVQRLKWQSEFFIQDRSEAALSFDDSESYSEESGTQDFRKHPWGLYSLVDYRFSQLLGAGTRFDYVEPVNIEVSSVNSADVGWSGYLTYFQSEFARWRLQYSHIEFASGGNDNQVLLQGTFALGTHKHKLQ